MLILSGFAQEGPPPPNQGTNAQYNIMAPSSSVFLVHISTNPITGDDNLVWSHSGRFIASDRSDPDITNGPNKYINLLNVMHLGNIQNLGARNSASNYSVLANITDWTSCFNIHGYNFSCCN